MKRWNTIQQQLHHTSIDFEFGTSQNREDGIQIIHEAISRGFKKFIVVGGDGTFNSLVNAIFTQQTVSPSLVTIAIIPIGTGNDWIKTHRIPKSSAKAIAVIKKENTRLHDVGIVRKKIESKVEERFFINVAGFAFQGFVAERIEGKSKWLKLGLAAFVLGIADALFRYKTTDVVLEMNGEKMEGKFINISAGICKYAGGGMKLTPDAVTDDGLFDITLAKNLTKWEVLINVPRLFSGSFVKHKKVDQFRMKRFSISSSPLFPIETDGEVFGYGNAEVEIIEKAIRVVVP